MPFTLQHETRHLSKCQKQNKRAKINERKTNSNKDPELRVKRSSGHADSSIHPSNIPYTMTSLTNKKIPQ